MRMQMTSVTPYLHCAASCRAHLLQGEEGRSRYDSNIYTASHSRLRHDTKPGFGIKCGHILLLTRVIDRTSAPANGHKYEKNKEMGGTGVICDGVLEKLMQPSEPAHWVSSQMVLSRVLRELQTTNTLRLSS